MIVGGHSHDLLPEGELVDRTLIVQAGSHGHHIGIVTVNSSKDPSEPLRLTARVEPL